jgi:CheY-like chemotaxis protein
MITELLSVFKTQANNQNISLYSKLPLNDEKSEIFSDKNKLTKIFTNLMVNALKFIKQGFIEIGYNVKENEFEFYVKDSGIGIKSRKLNEIFERFSQADNSISKNYGGTGLGLAISKAYVELLGGKIWVQSELGKGSIFYFTIPFKSVGKLNTESASKQIEKDIVISNELVHKSNKKDIAKQTKKSRTILIAEDEEYNFLLLSEFIYNMNLNILHTRNGEETVEICKTNPDINLILMDIKMPVMDGMAATKLIKKFRPNLPIIAQTAFALAHEIEKFKNQGFDDYITKPIKHEKLVELLEKYIKE